MADAPDPRAPNPDDAKLDALEEEFHAERFHAGVNDPGVAGAAAIARGELRAEGPGGEAGGSDGEPSHDELRSGALGQRLAKRRGYSLPAREPKTRRLLSSWGISAVLALSLWSLAGTWGDVRYYLSKTPPIDLGHLGGYHLDAAREGAFAKVSGVASPKRASYSRFFSEHELIPLIGSRILIDRDGSPSDDLRGFAFQYTGQGRLLRAEEGGKWGAVREQFSEAGELARQGDVWVLEDGLSPHQGMRVPLEVGGWGALSLACLAALLARLRARMRGADSE